MGAAQPRFRLEDSAFCGDFIRREVTNLLEIRNERRHSGLPLENWRCNMRASLRKSVVGSLAAFALGISTVAAVAPASAQTQGQSSWKNGQPNIPHGPGQGGHFQGGNGGGH